MELTKADDFVFDEKAHAYFLNDKPMLGCTSVLGVINKPALIQWAANEAVKYIQNGSIKDVRDENHVLVVTDALLQEAKTAHRKKKEDAAEKGTDLHSLVEGYVGYCIQIWNGRPAPFQDYANLHPNDETAAHAAPIRSFIEWAVKENIRFIATEQRLYSKELWVAGTCDLIFEKDGKRFIGDIKTYKKLWDRVPLIQCAGYSIMYEEMHGHDDAIDPRESALKHDRDTRIDGYCVICLPKDRAFNEAQDVMWSYDPDAEKQAFISAVKLYKYLNQN